MKKHLIPLIAAGALALTACTNTAQTADTPSLSAGNNPQAPAAYTWEAGAYPTDAPSLLTKEDPSDKTGWYMGSREEIANLQPQQGNFNTWQTIYSYKDTADARGATVAVVFYDNIEQCSYGGNSKTVQPSSSYAYWVMQDQRGLNTAAFYEYVFSGEGRTFPHANDTQEVKAFSQPTDFTPELINLPQNIEDTRTDNPVVEDAQIYSTNASSTPKVQAADAVTTPGRTATFYGNYTKDSNGELVPTGCATVYTALSEQAAGVYDQAKFAQAYEQAIEFAQQIETMPQKKAL